LCSPLSLPYKKIIESDPAPWGAESEAVSLLLPAEPTLREKSPNYLDSSQWGVESDDVSLILPAEPTL
jgi:hypothetical protein